MSSIVKDVQNYRELRNILLHKVSVVDIVNIIMDLYAEDEISIISYAYYLDEFKYYKKKDQYLRERLKIVNKRLWIRNNDFSKWRRTLFHDYDTFLGKTYFRALLNNEIDLRKYTQYNSTTNLFQMYENIYCN